MTASVPRHVFVKWLLRPGDNSLILSQRLGEWCGHGPVVEEDIALSNIALDYLGQARIWLSLAAEVEAAGRDEDQLAMLRPAEEFSNVLLVEQPNGNFADTIVRQFLFDTWCRQFYFKLRDSSDDKVAAAAQQMSRETDYHYRHSSRWLIRLGDGTELSHRYAQAAVDKLWCYTDELFDDDDTDRQIHAAGIAELPSTFESGWRETVSRVFEEARVAVPENDIRQNSGGRAGQHTSFLKPLLEEMQFMQRNYPGLQW